MRAWIVRFRYFPVCHCEDGQAGFKDRGERFHAIGDAGDDQVCFGGEDLFGVGGQKIIF